jgi:alpha-beta hydrolase superfamily lysophospholipase
MISAQLITPDGLKLHVRHWQIENPKAAILTVHTLLEKRLKTTIVGDISWSNLHE